MIYEKMHVVRYRKELKSEYTLWVKKLIAKIDFLDSQRSSFEFILLQVEFITIKMSTLSPQKNVQPWSRYNFDIQLGATIKNFETRSAFDEGTSKNTVAPCWHTTADDPFLANVNFRYMLSPVRLSVVCNVRAPYSGGLNFRQYFYGIRYLGHPLTSTGNFTEIVPGEPLRRGS